MSTEEKKFESTNQDRHDRHEHHHHHGHGQNIGTTGQFQRYSETPYVLSGGYNPAFTQGTRTEGERRGVNTLGGQTTTLPAQTGTGLATSQFVGTQIGAPQQVLAGNQVVGSQYVGSNVLRESIKGESRIEYVPYEKNVIEYEAVERVEYVPKTKTVQDVYAVEYVTEYVPQVYYDKYIEYVPQERVVERVEYVPIEKQLIHYPEEDVQAQNTVQQPLIQSSMQQPLIQANAQQPLVSSRLVSQQVGQPTFQNVSQAPIQTILAGSQYPVQGALQGSQIYQPVQYTNSSFPSSYTNQGQVVSREGERKAHRRHDEKKEKGFFEKLFE